MRYYFFVVCGLMAVGLGQCLVLWADQLKTAGATPAVWVSAGTGALAVFNAGLCLFGRGIVERVRQERAAGH